MYTSRAGGLPPSSNQPPQQGQPTAPPTFERQRRNSNARASDNLEPLPKKSRQSDVFGAPTQPTTASTQPTGHHTQPSVTASLQHGPRPTAPTTVMLPSNPVAPVNSNRQLVQQRLLNRSLLPTRTPTPQMASTLTSGELGMRGMAAAGLQGGQATSTRTHAPSRHGPQATTQTRVSGLAVGSAAPRSNDVFLRNLLASPVAPMTLTVTPTATPLVARQLPVTGTMQTTSHVPSNTLRPAATVVNARPTSTLPTPSFADLGVTADDFNQRGMMDEYLRGAPVRQAPLTAPDPLQNVPLHGQVNLMGNPQAVPAPTTPNVSSSIVQFPAVAAARSISTLPVRSTSLPFSHLGITPDDFNQRSMMDEYLQGAPMRQVTLPTASGPFGNPQPPIQSQVQAAPTLARLPRITNAAPLPVPGQNAGWANNATPASDPTVQNPPGI